MQLNFFKIPDLETEGFDELYSNNGEGIQRGHLNPVKINSFDANYVEATFAYSNAVPQYGSGSNMASWRKYELSIVRYVQNVCAVKQGIMYLMTGTSKFHLKVGAVTPTQDTVTEVGLIMAKGVTKTNFISTQFVK